MQGYNFKANSGIAEAVAVARGGQASEKYISDVCMSLAYHVDFRHNSVLLRTYMRGVDAEIETGRGANLPGRTVFVQIIFDRF